MNTHSINSIPAVESAKQFDPSFLTDDEEVVPVGALGDGLALTSRRTEELDVGLAYKMLEMNVFGPDRPLDNRHVDRLVAAMKRGTFRPEQVQLIICTFDGKEYRMNGQHTCWARIYLQDEKYRCPVQVLRYRASSETDMRMLYASIDRAKPRTKANVLHSYLYESDAFDGVSKTLLKQLGEGVAFWQWGLSGTGRHDGDDVAYLLKVTHHGLAMKVCHLLTDCQNLDARHLRRGPVYAAMFATFDKSEADSLKFWTAVRDGAGLDINDPRLKLRNHLQTHAVNAGRGGGSFKRSVNGEDMYSWCIQAWNAWREKVELRAFRSVQNRPTTK